MTSFQNQHWTRVLYSFSFLAILLTGHDVIAKPAIAKAHSSSPAANQSILETPGYITGTRYIRQISLAFQSVQEVLVLIIEIDNDVDAFAQNEADNGLFPANVWHQKVISQATTIETNLRQLERPEPLGIAQFDDVLELAVSQRTQLLDALARTKLAATDIRVLVNDRSLSRREIQSQLSTRIGAARTDFLSLTRALNEQTRRALPAHHPNRSVIGSMTASIDSCIAYVSWGTGTLTAREASQRIDQQTKVLAGYIETGRADLIKYRLNWLAASLDPQAPPEHRRASLMLANMADGYDTQFGMLSELNAKYILVSRLITKPNTTAALEALFNDIAEIEERVVAMTMERGRVLSTLTYPTSIPSS